MSDKRGIVLYLHVHQPLRVKQYSVFDTARDHNYFNEHEDAKHRRGGVHAPRESGGGGHPSMLRRPGRGGKC